jgi:hypothetical protein
MDDARLKNKYFFTDDVAMNFFWVGRLVKFEKDLFIYNNGRR